MKSHISRIAKLFSFAAIFLASKTASADTNTIDMDIMALPDYCAKFIKPDLEGTAKAQRWDKLLSGFDGIHHYCFGLNKYNKAWKTFDKTERSSLLKGAINEMSYPLNHHFNPKHPLSPKLLYDIGKASEAQEDYKSAIDYYKKSIDLNPNVWLPHAALSDIQVKLNLKKEAIETLKNGLKFKPNSKPLLKRLDKIQK
ncbi:tetratricopeptide repeat protein [Methylomonas sp. SURF-1]|uniref:Tetratricopeptide repeat protein n=1 Tax=Methylomonas aurea TaxID=2952224 RepID=A0ABT1UCX2_9GAMM|nr:tetratricopeptide repeat protein [Methylomonas sp. SURF-1]MCQ8179982.1 tetratricopeptide repeat protein [Methylomonas sp. SURF-1]